MSKQVIANILAKRQIQGSYYQIDFLAPEITETTTPGQFVHLQIPNLEGHLLRRPFSIFDTDAATGRLSLLFKVVGTGSARLSQLEPGTKIDILGPQGNGFSSLPQGAALVAGGYGCAALYGLAKNAAEFPPDFFIGGRSEQDLLLCKEYSTLRCQVHCSTDDGSFGFHGRITQLLEEKIRERLSSAHPLRWIAACGPLPMLKALSLLMTKYTIQGELSLDSAMCCGVGACFACVTKIKDASSPDGWSYKRICHDGPVFPNDQIYWD